MSQYSINHRGYAERHWQEKLTVLIAEDSEDDITLLTNALNDIACEHMVRIVHDGRELLDYLKGEGPYSDRQAYPFPGVLLLDLKMPRLSGFEVLRWLGKHPECCVMPTVVFSASAFEDDIKLAYELGASAYFVKPMAFQNLKEILRAMFEFWGKCVKPPLPQKCADPA
jgi:CheY-like chemotaxis protein